MKIKCEYCDNMIEDTKDVCPYCGGPNPHVVRSTSSQPMTIKELEKWYRDRGLPPYETTRFFIGIDYRKPRAFGIYKDETTGNFVVYKNKDSGQRAVRYEGTDEAYAVNELFMRLKQEILEQKGRNGSGRASGGSRSSGRSSSSFLSFIFSVLTGTIKGTLVYLFLGVAVFAIVAVFVMLFDDEPGKGYYRLGNDGYYYFSQNETWYKYDKRDDDWGDKYLLPHEIPSELEKEKSAKKYYLAFDWNENLNLPNFEDSKFYEDYLAGSIYSGYYSYGDDVFYNVNGDMYNGWYEYDNDTWSPVDYSNVPEDLSHYSSADDYFYTDSWDESTQFSDFEDSSAYSDYMTSIEESSDDGDGGWFNSSDDSYDWSSGDSWDSGGSWDSDW